MDNRGSNLEHSLVDAARSVESLPGPQGLPLLGNSIGIDSLHFHRMLEGWAGEFGPIFKFRLADRQFIATARRGDIATILHDRPHHWRRTRRMQDTLDGVGGGGLFTAEGDAWRRQRKLVMHALTPEMIHRFHPSLVRMTERLQRRWLARLEAGGQPDLARDLKTYALDVIVGLAMGEDMNSLENDAIPLQRDIEFLLNRVARRLTAPIQYWRTFRLPVDRQADAAAARLRAAVQGFVARARQRLAEEPALREQPANMLQAMVLQRDAPGSEMTEEDLVSNAVTMAFAGEDTTSNTIVWMLYLLAGHAPAWERLMDEASGLLPPSGVAHDHALLDRMAWLDLCTREAMRIKPVVPSLSFEPVVDAMLGDVYVPVGTKVITLTRLAFALDTQFERAAEFLPERWLEAPGESMDDPSRKLLPFGGGPRFCPGRYLATTEIRMVMSMLARSFSLSLAPDAPPVEELFTFTMTPSAVPVRLQRRVP